MKTLHYRMLMATSASPVFYPDEAPAAPAPAEPAAPALPEVEEPIVLPDTPPAEPASKDGEPPAEPAPKEPTDEEKAAAAAAAVPEAYTLTAGEGVELDAAMVEQATPIFKELGLNNEQAQKVVDLYQNTVLPEVAQTVQTQTLALLGMTDMANWAKLTKADKEIGGSNLEASLALAASVRNNKELVTPELRALFETTRLGNHPEVLRLFTRIGKAISESAVSEGATGATPLTAGQLMYGDKYAPKS